MQLPGTPSSCTLLAGPGPERSTSAGEVALVGVVGGTPLPSSVTWRCLHCGSSGSPAAHPSCTGLIRGLWLWGFLLFVLPAPREKLPFSHWFILSPSLSHAVILFLIFYLIHLLSFPLYLFLSLILCLRISLHLSLLSPSHSVSLHLSLIPCLSFILSLHLSLSFSFSFSFSFPFFISVSLSISLSLCDSGPGSMGLKRLDHWTGKVGQELPGSSPSPVAVRGQGQRGRSGPGEEVSLFLKGPAS